MFVQWKGFFNEISTRVFDYYVNLKKKSFVFASCHKSVHLLKRRANHLFRELEQL